MCSAETAAKLEESRRRDVFENSPDPSQENDVNMAKLWNGIAGVGTKVTVTRRLEQERNCQTT